MRRARRRYGRATAKGPLATFHAAARKVERMIEELASGSDTVTPIHEQSFKVSQAINRLEDRTNKSEIRGDQALRDEAYRVVRALREKKNVAADQGSVAVFRHRQAEIARLREKGREERDAMDPALRAYQDELKIHGGGRR